MGISPGIDPMNLTETGWGVIFSHDEDPSIRNALEELLTLRQQEAGQRFRVFAGNAGYQSGESKMQFLSRHGAGAGRVDPDVLPYYLLIVGNPEVIPYRFQQQLGVQHAVGRLHFDTLEEYASYARSVAAAESGSVKLARKAALFSTTHPADPLTQRITEFLMQPLYEGLLSTVPDWHFDLSLGNQANKAQLMHLLGGESTPALVFVAGHGMRFPSGSPRQVSQGAILCQDWPGPRAWQGAIPEDFYLSDCDIPEEANLLGTVVFFAASYSAGATIRNKAMRGIEIAPRPLVGALPRRLLSCPQGGALAVVGAIGSLLGSSPYDVFKEVVSKFLRGRPLGYALGFLTERYAELSCELSSEWEKTDRGKTSDPHHLADMWTSLNDLRSFVIMGDPAVRLPAAADGEVAAPRPELSISSERTALIYFNGINGASGDYGVPPMAADKLVEMDLEDTAPENLSELRYRHQQKDQRHFGIHKGIDPKKLDEAGWGVIFTHDSDPAVRHALEPLLNLRRDQAGDRFRVFKKESGYRSGTEFLKRHEAGPGPANPDKVPYYLLIVGSPEAIPFRFQSQLSVQYAVGRVHFDTVGEYATYAESVVAAEMGQLDIPRQVSFFGAENEGDPATRWTTRFLATPLVEYLREKGSDWQVSAFLRDEATKANLAQLLGGPRTPALLVTSGHGIEFPHNDSRQITHQGALLCQDWPGPGTGQGRSPIPQEFYFASDDLSGDATIRGLISFHFTSYSAGTPHPGELTRVFKEHGTGARAFLAALPAKMLGHPRGGALATVGHVDRAWGYSLGWKPVWPQAAILQSTLDRLFDGHPVGSALDCFSERHAELSTFLADKLEEIEFGAEVYPRTLAEAWAARNDARSFMIIGDPAVRLIVGRSDPLPGERPPIIPGAT